jgi:hypothetical protein
MNALTCEVGCISDTLRSQYHGYTNSTKNSHTSDSDDTFLNMNAEITLTELEQAINYWRMQRPSVGEEHALSPEVNALATIYALMIFNREKSLPVAQLDAVPLQLLEAWRNS